MEQNKLLSMAKAMKYVPLLLGVLCIILGAVWLFVSMEGNKQDLMFFSLFGIVGLAVTILGMALSNVLEALASIEEKSPEDGDGKEPDFLA